MTVSEHFRVTAGTSRQQLIALITAASSAFPPLIVDMVSAEVPAYARIGNGPLLEPADHTLATILGAAGEGRSLNDIDLDWLIEHGEMRARQGLPVEDMHRAWRVAVRTTLEEVARIGRRHGIPDHELLDFTNEALDITDTAMLAMVRGHRHVEVEFALDAQQRRADLVRGILYRTMAPVDIRTHAERYGLDVEREYHTLRAQLTPKLTLGQLERALHLTDARTRPHGLIALIDGVAAGFIDNRPELTLDTTIGIGPPARLDRIEKSFQLATRAMNTASAYRRTGTYDISQLGLLPAVLADADMGEEMTRRYLNPLGTGESAVVLIDTVRRYLTTSRRVDRTAQALFVHKNTVRYRLQRIEQLLDIDLDDPDATVQLWWALQRRELIDASGTADNDQVPTANLVR